MTTGNPSGLAVPGAIPGLGDRVLDQLLEHAELLIAVKDERLRFRRVSRRLQEVFSRLGCDDPIGKTVLEALPAAYAFAMDAEDRRVLRTTAPSECEGQLEVDGEVRTYLFSRTPLISVNGDLRGLCTVATEITVRKRTEDALRDVAIGLSGAGGEAVYRQIVRFLANTLGVEMAWIGVLDENGADRFNTLALWHAGRILPNVTYGLMGTPCRYVVGSAFKFIPEQLRALFPDADMIQDFGLESYAGFPLFDSRRQPLGLIGVADRKAMSDRQLTESILKIFSVRAAAEVERARAERERGVSEASYRNIFEATEDCIFIHDFDTGAILDVNPRACETYGYIRDELLRMDVGQLSSGEPPYTLETALGHIGRVRGGETVRLEWHRRNKDGSLHWDEVVLKTAVLAGKKRILAVTRDITERRHAEERLRATVEAALDSIVTMDVEGRIIEFNPAAEACFGYSRAEALGKPLADLLIPENCREAHRSGLQHYRATGSGRYLGRRVQVTAMRRDGSEFPAELAIAMARAPEGDIFIGYLRDVTEQREAERTRAELERQLRQAQKMEAIGHLTGGIAHDFNNILTSVLGYTVLAREQAPSGGTIAQYLEQVRASGERARDLIRQMLTFSRGERGEPRPLSLTTVVREAVTLFGSTFPSSIAFHTELASGVPPVRADPILIEQVLMNLCINARDAADGDGTIQISVRDRDTVTAVCASCRQSLTGPFVEVAVSDTGSGIETGVLERMFEPFYSTKEVGRGSGMGLATVHGIVHEYAGHLLVDTAPGRGSTFRVLLPPVSGSVTPSAKEGAAKTDAAMADAARAAGRVLVVDDEVSVRMFLRDLLESRGFSVTTATDGVEAFELLAESPDTFELIVTDQIMPGLTGLGLARRLRDHGIALPLILCTGYSEALGEKQVHGGGVDVLLRKPIEPAELLECIADLLEGG